MRVRLHVYRYLFTCVLTVFMETVDSFPHRQSDVIGIIRHSLVKSVKNEPELSSRKQVHSPQTSIIIFRNYSFESSYYIVMHYGRHYICFVLTYS